MKSRLVRGIDVSNYQPTDLTDLIQQTNAKHVIVRLSTEDDRRRNIAVQQLRCAANNGCSVSGYIWCDWDVIPEGRVDDALELFERAGLTPDTVGVVWLDAEDPPTGDVVNWLRHTVLAMKDSGFRPGIYTARWWWNQYLPDVTEFAHLPLWVADYNNDPTLDVQLFGGWTEASGHQYSGDSPVDLNVFSSEVTG